MGWRYTDTSRTVAMRVNEDGSMESCLVKEFGPDKIPYPVNEQMPDWRDNGGTIEDADPKS